MHILPGGNLQVPPESDTCVSSKPLVTQLAKHPMRLGPTSACFSESTQIKMVHVVSILRHIGYVSISL